MTLPTPPRTSHREEKENRTQTSSRVVWSQHNQYHNLSSPPKGPTASSAAKEPPTKSILKKTLLPFLPLENECEQREATPEPSNPLSDPTYLNTPISTIISCDSEQKLTDLIEAYSVLAARIRPYVHEGTDASCGIFNPLKDNRDCVLKSIIRDLGRALVNPVPQDDRERAAVLLPSPTKSPKKKRGMTAEQAKFARDLCTLSHSVLKLLGLVFTTPAIYTIFTDANLRGILTGVLAIPLAYEIPTPNARKTCALAICLLQAQRLPSSVLVAAGPRIAFALRRGMDGELGKEGKKGSANDGLKAIHDLSVYQPKTFIPAFAPVIESVLANLLAPSLALRVQACHALGGLAIGSIEIPTSEYHTRISSAVAHFLFAAPPRLSPSKGSPSRTGVAESPICKTLRTTLNNEEPLHVAQGPVWALSVLASFAVLLGSTLFKDQRLSRILSSLVSIPLRHKKSSVRCLACVVWRSLTWAYYQPPLPSDMNGESEVEEDSESAVCDRRLSDVHFKTLQSVLHLGAGTSLVAACVGSCSEADERTLRRITQLLEAMIRKSTDTMKDAVQIITQLVCLSGTKDDWDMNTLLPTKVFSSVPGLLTSDFTQLQPIVRKIYEECPGSEDVRPLTREELSRDGLIDEFFHLWQRAAFLHDVFQEDVDLVKEAWAALLNAAAVIYEDGTERGSDIVAEKVVRALRELLSRDLECGTPDSTADSSASASKLDPQSAVARTLSLLQELWKMARDTLTCENIDYHAEPLLQCLIKYEEEMNVNEESSRGEWASFCVELALTCGGVDAFWTHEAASTWEWSVETRSRVWGTFVDKAPADRRSGWDDAFFLLSVPFKGYQAWDLQDEDLETWSSLLDLALEKGRDSGLDDLAALNKIADTLHQPAFESCSRVAEMLLNKCQLSEEEELPHLLVEFVTDTLRSRYPPKPNETCSSLWILRELAKVLDGCPRNLALPLLETLQEGVSLWISDDLDTLTILDYDEVVTFYETLMGGALRNVPESPETFETLSPLLEAVFLGREDKPAAVLEAFNSYWEASSYARTIPSSDWPVKIQEHFEVEPESVPSPGLPPSSPPASDDEAEETEAESTPPVDIFSLLPAPMILSTPPGQRSRTSTSTPCCSPKTPTVSSHYSPISTPPTPSASSKHSTPCDAMPLIRSPLTFTSPVNKRRRMENKENESPQVLSLSSPARPILGSPCRKRRLSPSDDDERTHKRARVDLATLASIPRFQVAEDNDDEGAVEKMLIPQDEKPAFREDVFGITLQPGNKKKRKAMVLDAVEVPTLQEVQRRKSPIYKLKLTPKAQASLLQTPHKEKIPSLFLTPKTPEVLDLNSDDSIMLSSPAKKPSQLSSDDDPHHGQVTPHHLISPALRRAWRQYDDDPPSDDSVISGSPSKGVVLRRMQRLGSATRTQSYKPLVRIA
ncbi:hypothetical protein PM082_017256 [Marasmius tenuissimus]|nr:hypothetical protein PM082_017256 [Marasmius tenuissimus]